MSTTVLVPTVTVTSSRFVELVINGRSFAATKVEIGGRPSWLIAGARSARYIAKPSTDPTLFYVFDLEHEARQPWYGLELRESGNTLIVHRHPGGHSAPVVALPLEARS